MDTDHYLVVAKLRHRLSLGKWAAQKFDVKRFSLKKLTKVELTEQYQIKISLRFAAWENLNDSDNANKDWENIKQNIKISAKNSLKTVWTAATQTK
jgi:hypothetical protein